MLCTYLYPNFDLIVTNSKSIFTQLTWVGAQTKKSHPDFAGMFDALRDTDVRWDPFSAVEVSRRCPQGVSSLCTRDQDYWMTRKALVYDIHVEEYSVHRVMRQFGLYQESPLPPVHTVPSSVHRYVPIFKFISFAFR